MSSSTRTSVSTAETEDSSSDDGENPIIAPSADQLRQTFASSTQYWNDLACKGHSTQMKHDTIRLDKLLHRVPALPEDLVDKISVSGYASWKLISAECKRRLSNRHGQKQRWFLDLPQNRPTLCSVSIQKHFTYADAQLSGVSLMFLAWAYIFSMTLLEKQGLPMLYSDSMTWDEAKAIPQSQNTSYMDIYIGRASIDEWRWWSALVHPGQGWRPGGESIPPWTVAFRGNVKFVIKADVVGSTNPDDCTPPSSDQAVCFLSKFASAYGLTGQSSLALAMVLSLPLHNQTRSAIELPATSSFTKARARASWGVDSASPIQRDFEKLPRYMALSSNPQFLSSALWGIFWEPGIDCNLVSAWCEPIIRVVSPLVQSGNIEVLAHIFAQRRPNIAALWYGVLACGRTRVFNAIINYLNALRPPVPCKPMAEIAAWTGSPQSFMDVCGSGPYLSGDQVTRADVWRLRHECWNVDDEGVLPFRNPPLCPWQPFGTMLPAETELSVRPHLECRRHEWAYLGWTWLTDDGCSVIDHGLRSDENISVIPTISRQEVVTDQWVMPSISKDNIASRKATGDIFRWAATEMEPSGKEIYSHPWVEALRDLEMGQDDIPSDTASVESTSGIADRVHEWLGTLGRGRRD